MTVSVTPGLVALLRGELRIDNARWARVTGMTVCATLVTTVLLVFRVPLVAYAPYVVLMAAQRNLVSSIALSLSALAAIAVGISLSLLCYLVDIDEPALRLPTMAVIMFWAMYLSRTPRTGPLFFLTGYILVVTQTLGDQLGDPEALTHLLLWLFVVAASACGTAALAEAAWGRPPAHVLAEGLRQRAGVAMAALTGMALAAPGIPVRELAMTASGLGRDALARLSVVLQLEELARLRGARAVTAPWTLLAQRIGAATGVRMPRAGTQTGPLGDDEVILHAALLPVVEMLEGTRATVSVIPADAAGARHPATDRRFAFKATLAAMACYAVYSALDWPGIRTALITCFFVAMNSTGETIHKLSLRIIGAAMGGLLAALLIIFVFPWIDDIGGFVAVFSLGTLFCAWATTAQPLLAYAGQQITLAFYLGALQDTGPTDDLTVLRDRLVGVFLGNVAMSIVFATLWPVRTLSGATAALAGVARRQAAMLKDPEAVPARNVIANAVAFEEAASLVTLSAFDEGTRSGRRSRNPHLVDAMETAVVWSSAWVINAPTPNAKSGLAERFQAVAEALEASQPGYRQGPYDGWMASLPPALQSAVERLARETGRAH